MICGFLFVLVCIWCDADVGFGCLAFLFVVCAIALFVCYLCTVFGCFVFCGLLVFAKCLRVSLCFIVMWHC